MNRLKKFLAGIMAMSCIISTASCTKSEKINDNNSGSSSSANKENAEQVQEIMQKSYKAVSIEAECPFDYLQVMNYLGDTGKIFLSGITENSSDQKNYITDTDFSSFKEVVVPAPEGENVEIYSNVTVTTNGNIMAFATIIDYGDFELPDYNDPDFDYENFDYEAMEEAAVYSYKLYCFDSEGSLVSETEIEDLKEKFASENDEDYFGVNQIFPVGEEKLCITISTMEEEIFVTIDKDGNISDPIDLGDDAYFYTYGSDSNDRFSFISYDDDGAYLKFLDTETMTVSPEKIKLEDNSFGFNSLVKGSGEHLVYLSSSNALFGVKEDGTMDEIINWIDSDLSGNQIQSIIPAENDEFIIYERDWEANTSNFYRLTKRDASEIENVQIINMVVEYSDPNITNLVKEFNKSNTDCRIKIEDYSQYYEWDEESETTVNDPYKQLKQDIASGKDIDLICMPSSSNLFSNLSKKGALTDLYTYLDNGDGLSRDDIVPTILNYCERDGKLTSIAPSFSVMTLACKSKFFDKDKWTPDEAFAVFESLPEGTKLLNTDNTNMVILQNFIMLSNDFIDTENATCNFDSPEFIKMLEFCNQFPSEGEGDEIDWENATNEEMEEYWKESELALRNDKALLGDVYLDDLRNYAHAIHGQFGEPISLVGIPTYNGKGANIFTQRSFAIMETSDAKDACWKFICKFFEDKYQSEEYLYEIPALKSAFTKKLDDTMEDPYYIDEEGKKQTYKDTYYSYDEEIEIPNLTKEERDYLEEYILNAGTASFAYDETVYNIITEEAEAYFAGDKTAEQTAEIIQNRVSIIISEQS